MIAIILSGLLVQSQTKTLTIKEAARNANGWESASSSYKLSVTMNYSSFTVKVFNNSYDVKPMTFTVKYDDILRGRYCYEGIYNETGLSVSLISNESLKHLSTNFSTTWSISVNVHDGYRTIMAWKGYE